MKHRKHYLLRRKLPNFYKLRYNTDAFNRREYLISLINYLCYRDVD